MPRIKNISAISYSSQDPKHSLQNFLTADKPWLISSEDKSGKLTADLQLSKATTISYVDVGNHNSITLSIEVSRSLGNASAVLLPSAVLMTPQQFRLEENNKAVRMFKTSDLNKDAVNEKWDRVRIVCSQPFKRDVQFGLSFLKLYTTDAEEQERKTPTLTDLNNISNSSSEASKVVIVPSKFIQKNKSHNMYTGNSSATDYDLLKKLQNKQTVYQSRRTPVRKPSEKRVNPDCKSPRSKFFEKLNSESNKPLTNKINKSSVNGETRSSMNVPKKLPSNVNNAHKENVSAVEPSKRSSNSSPSFSTKKTVQKFPSFPSTCNSSSSYGTDENVSSINYLESVQEKQKQFEYDALEFLISLSLTLDQINHLKVSDVRRQFEGLNSRTLTQGERLIFKELALDFCKRRCDVLEKMAMNEAARKLHGQVIDVNCDEEEVVNIPPPPTATNLINQSKLLGNFNSKTQDREKLIEDSNKSSPYVANKDTSKPKFTFKRLSDTQSDSSNECSPKSSKKAKFRQDNPIESISAVGLHRNKLSLIDSNSMNNEDTLSTQTPSKKNKVSKNSPSVANTVNVWLPSPKTDAKTKPNNRTYLSGNVDKVTKSAESVKNTKSSEPVKKPFSFRSIINLDDDEEDILAVEVVTKRKEAKNSLESACDNINKWITVDRTADEVNKEVKGNSNGGHTLGQKPKDKFGVNG